MNIGRIPALIMAFTLLALLYGGTAAWAQCPTSPDYYPDFSSAVTTTCLTLNGIEYDTPSTTYPGFYPVVTPPTPPPVVATVLRLTPNQSDWAGSAWYNTQQPVAGAFSTTFWFELSGADGISGPTYCPGDLPCPADGIAFVIQNSAAGTGALGPEGCGIGFGWSNFCLPLSGPQTGIPNSLAVEFKTFYNTDSEANANSVSIQNCSGTGANSVDNNTGCTIAVNNNLLSTLADGNVHKVTINYSGPSTTLLDVILDNNDLFPGGVAFDLATIGLNSGNAWVGFTAATGGGNDNQDILNWTFTPQAQTAVISTTTKATLSFPNASGVNVYDYTAQLTSGSPVEIQVQPFLMTQAACDALVQKTFWPARCFVYENAENTGLDAAVMFALTCPQSPGGTCGSSAEQDFFAELGTDFQFLQSENPFFTYPGVNGLQNPFPGFLKGVGPNPQTPCTQPTFQSNQIDRFYIDNGHTTGGSGDSGSCWVATYDTPGEALPGITISSPTSRTYLKNQSVTASYTCSNPITSKPESGPQASVTGPYLTVLSCMQSELPPDSFNTNSCVVNAAGGLTCSGPVDTLTLGAHTFLVTAIDTGGNTNVQKVVYTVIN